MDKVIDVSLVIPCHNLEQWILPLIKSLNNLDLSNVTAEFIFVLDGCTDRTKEVIERNLRWESRIIECEVRSCGRARNIGMELARGEFLWFVDGDDMILDPNVLHNVIPLLRQKPECPAARLKWSSNHYKLKLTMMVWQYIFRRQLVEDIFFTDKQPGEDQEWTQKVFQLYPLHTFYHYPFEVYYYNYRRPGSNTTQFHENGKIIY